MHVSKVDLEPTVFGEHDRTMAAIARNIGAVVAG